MSTSPACPEIEFLYEQGPVMVVNKPAGLLTQAPPEIDSMEWRLKRFLKNREGKQGNVYLGVPHRLDRPVSGAMVFAKHVRATRGLSAQFEYRSVQKKYWAITEGLPSQESGQWMDFMRKIPGEARSEIVDEHHPDARLAILNYRYIKQLTAGLGLLEITLQTGRTHQIRLQCSRRNLPILGDAQYQAKTGFGEFEHDERKRQIALHARSLKFQHPMTDETVSCTAPLPATWEQYPVPLEDSPERGG